ncbi:MAG: cell division protein FtsA [Alphaproteobacteria bacterium]|nr:cell division protein FtsA [Alphaproteobacteria bacterium]
MTSSYRKAVIRKPNRQRSGVIAALDIGTSKIACLIAENDGSTGPVVKGIGQHASHGMRNGEVVDIEALSVAVGKTIEAAEGMAGFTIDRVCVSVSGGTQMSILRRHETEVASGEVTFRDIARIHRMDLDVKEAAGRVVLHRLPLQYILDGVKGIRDPLTMRGRKLGGDLSVITASEGTINNLTTVVERNHVMVERFASSCYVAGLSSLVEDEKDLGATVIEMGAGVTSLSIFMEGHLVYADAIPVGGQHVTSDVARAFSTPVDEAERIKSLHGSVLTAGGDSDHMITMPMIGENTNDTPQQVEIGYLGDIIRPRVEEIFELLMKRLEQSGFATAAGQRVILVGGASQLAGMTEYVSTIFGRSVRVGKPIGIIGMADATRGPAFSAAAGLLRYASVEQQLEPRRENDRGERSGMLNRITDWFNNHI